VNSPPIFNSASILNRIKEGYLIWVNIVPHIAKGARYTIGSRIENKFLDLLELSYIAYFSEKEQKQEKISKCILTLDILKFLVSIGWEAKIIPNNKAICFITYSPFQCRRLDLVHWILFFVLDHSFRAPC